MNRFEEAAIMRCKTTPQPIDWQPGDLAWYNGILVELVHRASDGYWDTVGGTFGIAEISLTIPTRAQLAREIGKDKHDKPILAWACESAERRCHVYHKYCDSTVIWYPQSKEHDAINRCYCSLANILLVTVSQIDRHYNGVFPPEE